MADVAIAMKQSGHTITGSFEEINPDLSSKLLAANIIKNNAGWDPENIQPSLDAVIVGISVKEDNPELKKAMALKLALHSLPDLIYQRSVDKQRIVIAGGYGKATIMRIIIHVLNFHKRKFDYVLFSNPAKLKRQVQLSTAPLIIIEGQDIMSSVNDKVPAFLKYQHHIGVISGIEWQKSETYPTKEEYTYQFGLFGKATPKGGTIIYFELDPVVAVLSGVNQPDITLVPYKTHASDYDSSQEYIINDEKKRVPVKITGKHNLQSISAAKEVLKKIGVTSDMFYEAIPTFEGVN
jgi:UDP-N-acetylmuramate: L-alanyl-gamma-D-glutamyl-meso-diaminopimelate ligase